MNTSELKGDSPSARPVKTHLPVRRILVPIDFSSEGQPAVDYARQYAETSGAKLVLVHIVEQLAYAGEFSPVLLDTPKIREQALKKLQALGASFEPRVHSEQEVREGMPYHEIVKGASRLDCDLIIMSTHGRTGFMHVLMGSTAERVVRHASCPVLIVPSRTEAH
jgi:universal stress protein A